MKSMFITFEGNDGSGKSSVIEAIREELTKRGYDIVVENIYKKLLYLL